MSTKGVTKPLGALVAVTLLFALPAIAQAQIAFVRGTANQVVYTANDNGSGVKRIDKGSSPKVSPDGASVAYWHEGPGHDYELKLAPVGGGKAETLMTDFQAPYNMVWSPNSEYILAQRGGELGKTKLVVVTVASDKQRVLASGFFNGYSFDPESKEVVFGVADSERFPPKSDVFRVSAGGGKLVALTRDHISEDPLWGPTGKIAFVKLLEANKRKYAPKNEIYLMNPNGKGVKRLTHTNVDQLLQGLFPTAWSANGKRLLTQFEGQDTSYAVGVSTTTGAQRPILEAAESGLVGAAISPDGKTVYGAEGGFDPGNAHNVVSVPWNGGKAKVLAKNASLPSFSF